ncbi:MAG: hypothetical protein M1830_003360 [Pleopsidium flavum]|nr:MAG: hypothetical protein M1830_003360 [Pleopsidium flavum]
MEMNTLQAIWSSVFTVFYYLLLPIIVILKWLLTTLGFIVAPLLHLGHYTLHACLWPLRILAKFETLYIFFGVAALVGAVTGLVLHLSSSFVATTLSLDAVTEEQGRTVASYRAEKQRAKLSIPRIGAQRKIDRSLKTDYADWLGKDKGQGRKGLLSTTILEENDDSEDDS